MLTTWRDGREALSARRRELGRPIGELRDALDDPASSIARVPGTAVYLAAIPGRAPTALVHNMVANDVLHERVVVVTVQTEGVPHVDAAERSELPRPGRRPGRGRPALRVHGSPRRAPGASARGTRRPCGSRPTWPTTSSTTTRWCPSPTGSPWTRWRAHLLALMLRNASDTADYFRLPSDQTMVLSARVEM